MDKFLGRPKKIYTSSRGGYITLIGVLVVGAVGVSVTVSLVLLGLAFSRTSFAGEQSARARALADACAEEALLQIHDSVLCVGGLEQAFSQGSCAATVTSDTGTCTVNATGTVNTILRRTQVVLSSVDPLITVSSWREVADF